MSKENVEIVREAPAAFVERGVEAEALEAAGLPE